MNLGFNDVVKVNREGSSFYDEYGIIIGIDYNKTYKVLFLSQNSINIEDALWHRTVFNFEEHYLTKVSEDELYDRYAAKKYK